MAQLFLFALLGLGIGAIYAGIAMGLVITFKGTGVINFAQAAIAMWGAFSCDELRRTGDLVLPVVGIPARIHLGPQPLASALPLALLSAAVVGLGAHVLIFRPLRRAPALAKVVASLGLFIVLQALVGIHFGLQVRVVGHVFPNQQLHLSGLIVPSERLYVAATAVLVAVALSAYFRFTRLGLATRAAAENEMGASLTRISPDFVAATTWVLASIVTALIAIVGSPVTDLGPGAFALFIVPGVAVALVGRLTSLGVAMGAGLALGSFQAVIAYVTTKSWWPKWAVAGLTDAVPFLVVIIALYALGTGLPTRGIRGVVSLPAAVRPRNRPFVVGAMVVVGLVLVLGTAGRYRYGVITSMTFSIVALSLVLLTGLVGQISLAQAAFAGSAGFVLSKIGGRASLPFPVDVLVAASVACLLGLITGIPALRIRGAQLAVVTLAGAVAIERFVFRNPELVSVGGEPIPSPKLFGINLGIRAGSNIARVQFGLLVLVVLTLVTLAVSNLARGDTGRAFLAVRSNERAAAAAGIGVTATKLLAFGLSSFLAGLGGAFIGYSRSQLSADSFGVFAGLSFLAFSYLGGIASISGALIAGLLAPLGILYVVLDRSQSTGRNYFLASGISLIVFAIINPQGIAGRARQLRLGLARRWAAARAR